MRMQQPTNQQSTSLMIGAEVFIEPGQTPEEIDLWFRCLQEAGMSVTRIRLFESYMRNAAGEWDFSLFDIAYRAAEKYNIKVWGNLFPATAFTDLGGLKFPRDEEHFGSIAKYIVNVVPHFNKFESHYGWVPVNEPGVGSFPTEAFAAGKYAKWKALQAKVEYDSNGYDHFDFADERFHLYYNTWFLNWLTDEIHLYDKGSTIHVNNHAIFRNVAEYDFPAWRRFLTSLGGSAHASWHFEYFKRPQYALAVAANCEILRSGAGEIPWFMTELQGGNNTYSGFTPLCPTSHEIAQWLWIALATESKGAIFWCLNPRSSGIEAGEWAMLNYHNQPSDRLLAAKAVIDSVNTHLDFFENAKVVESGINIIYTRESLWVEKKLQMGGDSYPGRDVGSVMQSAIAYFEALSEAGLQANFKEISEFDFTLDNYSGSSIILAHQIAIPSRYWEKLKRFVQKGGTLLADGLTAYYDENAVALTRLGFPLRKLFGADVMEYKAIGQAGEKVIDIEDICLPACGWTAILNSITAQAIATTDGHITATKNKYGNGTAWWLSTLAGLGSRLANDYSSLNDFLKSSLRLDDSTQRFTFSKPQPGLLMRTLVKENQAAAVIINKTNDAKQISLLTPSRYTAGKLIFADKGGSIDSNDIKIGAEETLVVHFLSVA
ncbi:hypothetical protein FPZ43_06620 [Mucilaginibacter pallidiroseus]|uniref:Beta-galactosidase trimerisation domain-containing protein n=1 Tax=Mucilaginibacter pallidiroseus TaxID=2599295 RepID=A0A563UH20_9SPHI|nr:beta-galactosidase trimerization domain-containing protein [Mucilaginibacter pallidiroseus]TWR30606.1 hypothetical protein FPZ43_06620 [Mucilaginibacter pallidiroseus]